MDWTITQVHDGSGSELLGYYKVEAKELSGRGKRKLMVRTVRNVPHWEILVEEDSDQ